MEFTWKKNIAWRCWPKARRHVWWTTSEEDIACLHPDTKSRPTIRKVEQIFLNPDEPLMEFPESRPNAIFVPLSSSLLQPQALQLILGLKVRMSCCSQPLKRWSLMRLLSTMKILTYKIGLLWVLKIEFYFHFLISICILCTFFSC